MHPTRTRYRCSSASRWQIRATLARASIWRHYSATALAVRWCMHCQPRTARLQAAVSVSGRDRIWLMSTTHESHWQDTQELHVAAEKGSRSRSLGHKKEHKWTPSASRHLDGEGPGRSIPGGSAALDLQAAAEPSRLLARDSSLGTLGAELRKIRWQMHALVESTADWGCLSAGARHLVDAAQSSSPPLAFPYPTRPTLTFQTQMRTIP